MYRHVLIMVTALSIPGAGAAQLRAADEGWGPFIRVTPFVGFSPSFKSAGNLLVATQTAITPFEYKFDYGPGSVSGVNVEVRAYNRFSGIGALAWTSRGRTVFETEEGELFEDAGSDFYIAKAGGALRFRELESDLQRYRLNASVFLAGAFMRESPEVLLFSSSAFTKARNHWGINFGAEGELPLANRKYAFHGGFEDYVIFWDEEAVRLRIDPTLRAQFGDDAQTDLDADHSHLIVFRLGFSVRFGQ